MPKKKYLVQLSEAEQQTLNQLLKNEKTTPRQVKRVMILLKAHEGWHDPQIMAAYDVSRPCVERLRQRYVEGGLERALYDKQRPGMRRKVDGRVEAHLAATACSDAPEGHDHWTLRLLADKLVELGVVESISYETVRRHLKKTN